MLLTKRQNEILMMIKEKSPISGDEIAQKLSVTKSALRTDFSILTGLKLITSKPNRGYIYNFFLINGCFKFYKINLQKKSICCTLISILHLFFL